MAKKKYNCSYIGMPYDFRDKSENTENLVRYMLARTQSMFKYEGLPETIPQRILEMYLQMNGNVCFYKHNGKLYVFTGGLGGEPDVYYMPTVYTIANPALNISKNLKIDVDCVVFPSDSMYIGLLPLFRKYASAMVENELSMHIADINSRIFSVLSAPDDRTMESAKKYLTDVEEGKLGVVGESAFFEGIKTSPYGSTTGSGVITDLIEYEQYLKASWYNDIGLNANYNMKRESINAGESQLNNDALLPLVDDMLNCRRKGLEKVNAMFGTNITVALNSSWEDNEIEIAAEQGGTPDET